jgi:hypothetical protein
MIEQDGEVASSFIEKLKKNFEEKEAQEKLGFLNGK